MPYTPTTGDVDRSCGRQESQPGPLARAVARAVADRYAGGSAGDPDPDQVEATADALDTFRAWEKLLGPMLDCAEGYLALWFSECECSGPVETTPAGVRCKDCDWTARRPLP